MLSSNCDREAAALQHRLWRKPYPAYREAQAERALIATDAQGLFGGYRSPYFGS